MWPRQPRDHMAATIYSPAIQWPESFLATITQS
jgi:hypothetical protein